MRFPTPNPGDVVAMRTFSLVAPGLTVSFKAPDKRVAVFMLLGDAPKENPDSFDAAAALRLLGWYPETDFGPYQPASGSIQDRAAALAASLKVMAALHRANEDVGAADEFGQGATLIAEMQARLEKLEADAERWQFLIALNTNKDLEAKASELEGFEMFDPETCTPEEIDAHMVKVIAMARDAGIWPVAP